MGLIFIVVLTVFYSVHCVSVSDNNGTAAEDVDAEMLMGLGRQLNKPMLTVIGMAMRNLQKLHPCDEWTPWSDCGASRVGYVSTKNRKRQCISETSNGSEKVSNETEISICEGFCPNDYNITTNGFCIKLYVSTKTHDDAEKQCDKDGGFLINVESERKYKDIKTMVQGFSSNVHIGGRRKDANSAWKFQYGKQSGFFKWASSNPSTSATCLVFYTANSLWYGVLGTSARPFLCEIIDKNSLLK